MSNKIVVAGAGHGGIAAAALLAEKGFDVTIYERYEEGNLGYDWTDIFAPQALKIAGLSMPPADKWEYKENMTFYGPSMNSGKRQNVPENQLEIKMERKDIYNHLIAYALQKGVKFIYSCNVTAPILLGNRVVGIDTSLGKFYGDLIIDAAGVDSPLRSNLPKSCGIENAVGPNEQIYIYRAFFDKATEEPVEDKYKIMLFPRGEKVISWVATEEDHSDLLIGSFEPYTIDQINDLADYLRSKNPSLGTELKRGGQFVKIPVRQPLSVMVCDGYAAIGDSAFMTVPVIGSGIANSLKAARMLSIAVDNDKTKSFSAETLWPYQVDYYKYLGSSLAVLACIKLILLTLTPEELDYMFDQDVLTADDLTIGADATDISSFIDLNLDDVIHKVKEVVKKPELLKKILGFVPTIVKAVKVSSTLPKQWHSKKVMQWAKEYQNTYII